MVGYVDMTRDHSRAFDSSRMTLFDECLSSMMYSSSSGRNSTNDMMMMNNLNYSNSYPNDNIFATTTTPGYSLLLEESIVSCISNRYTHLQALHTFHTNEFHTWMVLFMGAIVFFMQTGFAMICAGCVRKKNLQNTMLKNLLDACISLIIFYLAGYALSYGGRSSDGDYGGDRSTFIGETNFFSTQIAPDHLGIWFYQYTLSATCITIVAGTVAERCQMVAYIYYCMALSLLVFPVIAHAIWDAHGYLSINNTQNPLNGIGVIDFSGSGVIHLTGGVAALIATYILGPRHGRFPVLPYAKGNLPFIAAMTTPKQFTGNSIALQVFGTLILWFGWYGFNAGSALLLPQTNQAMGTVASLAIANTSLAAAAGACSALFTNMFYRYHKSYDGTYSFNITMAMNGTLSGLVAITAGCATVELWAAIVIGIIAGWIYIYGSYTLIRYRLDDVVDGIPIHLLNGAWGMISTGLFSSPHAMKIAYGTDQYVGLFYEIARGQQQQGHVNAVLLGNQCIAIVFIAVWTTVWMYPLFWFLDYMNWFRTGSMEEIFGLDLKYHGTVSSPETKQEIEEDIAQYQQDQLLLQQQQEQQQQSERGKSSNSKKTTSDGRPRGKRSTSSRSSSSSTTTSASRNANKYHLRSGRTMSSGGGLGSVDGNNSIITTIIAEENTTHDHSNISMMSLLSSTPPEQQPDNEEEVKRTSYSDTVHQQLLLMTEELSRANSFISTETLSI